MFREEGLKLPGIRDTKPFRSYAPFWTGPRTKPWKSSFQGFFYSKNIPVAFACASRLLRKESAFSKSINGSKPSGRSAPFWSGPRTYPLIVKTVRGFRF